MIEAGIIGEDEKFELLEGEIVMMASKGIAHERIKSALLIAVARSLPDDLTMGVEVTLRLTDMTMLEPDIAVFRKALFKRSSTGFARLDPGEACLVIEVAVSNLAYDKGSRHGFTHATSSENSGLSTPTNASLSCTPDRTATDGHQS
jgi:Uma2 family endonuclease